MKAFTITYDVPEEQRNAFHMDHLLNIVDEHERLKNITKEGKLNMARKINKGRDPITGEARWENE